MKLKNGFRGVPLSFFRRINAGRLASEQSENSNQNLYAWALLLLWLLIFLLSK